MASSRQDRVKVLEALERAVKQFRTREELYPLRVPREPLAFERVIAHALGEEAAPFEPATLRSRTVLRLEWADGSAWELWVIVLPSGLKLFCASSEEESSILASGGRNLGDESERLFVEILCESAGAEFGIEMAGGPPARVRAALADRDFLIDCFVDLFEGTDAEAVIRDAGGSPAVAPVDRSEGRDFRAEVEAWLDHAMR